MDNNKQTDVLEKQKRAKRVKRKLLPAILAGFSLPVTLFLYGPFDLFAQNRAEFSFALGDFFWACLLLTLLCGTVLSVIPLFLRKKVYAVYTAVLFWASVMCYIQGNYLNFGLDSLAGDGVGGGAVKTSVIVVNTLIWVLTLAAVVVAVLMFKQLRKKLRAIVSLGIALVLVMEIVGVVAVSVTKKGVYSDPIDMLNAQNDAIETKMLTTKNITTLSDNSNIVVFIVDRFDVNYYYEAMAKRPELFDELDGFTHYADHISMYCRTYPAVANLLTGQRHDYSMTREEYLEYAYNNASYLKYLNEQGYDVNIYTDKFFSYVNGADMDEYTSNVTGYDEYEIKDRWGLIGSMLSFSMYRYFPFLFKTPFSQMSTQTFTDYVEFVGSEGQYYIGNVDAHHYVTREDFELEENSKRFTFLHIDGCHVPNARDENFNLLDEYSYDIVNVMTQSFKVINRYLQEMKRLGVYEDSTIIITGDHAAAISDREPVADTRLTTLLVKPKGVCEGEIVTNNAPTHHDDIWPTIFASEGLTDYPEVRGRSVFDIAEDEVREREYVFHRLISDGTEEITYKITGRASVFSNWEIVKRESFGIEVYD